jgi:Immunoglobulin I-set domain
MLLLRPLLLAAILTAPARADVRIGGFDASRAGLLSMSEGQWLTTLRAAVSVGCPATAPIYGGTSVITPTYLATIDVFIVSTVTSGQTGLPPLTSAEQDALYQFVLAGGGVVIFADNDGVAGSGPGSPNGSVVGVFGCSVTGSGAWPDPATVSASHPVTNGPHGAVTAFDVLVPGWFDLLGPSVTPLAHLNSTNAPVLAVIDRDALGPGSGGVVLFSDTSLVFDMFIGGSGALPLALNAIEFASPYHSRFTQQPQSQTGYVGDPAVFSVTVSGPGPFTYQWRKDGQNLADGGRFAGVLTDTLTVNYLAMSDAGNYDVLITGPCGPATSTAAALTVLCYPNCDGSTTPPILNITDFACFLNLFAARDPYANCDHSTTPPLLSVADFACFLNKYAAGCP